MIIFYSNLHMDNGNKNLSRMHDEMRTCAWGNHQVKSLFYHRNTK